jgi:hypothetical protein
MKYLKNDDFMNTRKRQKHFHAGLVLALFLLLWNPLPASSFAQNGGGAAGPAGEEKVSGITMQTVSGRVVEIVNSGGYTYALVDEIGAMTWVALPKGRITVGNEITCQPGMVMNNFSSPSLNRTFKNIVFSSGITSLSRGTAPRKPQPR